MKKYTDEQVSRILSCAAAGELGPPSGSGCGTFCIEEAGTLAENSTYLHCDQAKAAPYDRDRAYNILTDKVLRDPDAVLSWLEEKRFA